MCLPEANASFISRNTDRDVQAPTLLGLPFAMLAAASIGAGFEWVWARVMGSLLLVSISIACAVGVLKKCRIPLRPMKRTGPLDAMHRSGDEHVILATQLTSLGHVQKHGSPGVRSGASFPSVFQKVLSEATKLGIDETSDQIFVSPLHDRQLGIAGIFFAISTFALVVVLFLVTGQLQGGGPVTLLGLSLGAFLVSVPLVIGIHLRLGRVQVNIDGGQFHVECRQGIFGTKKTVIPLSDIEGVWLIQMEDAVVHELLILHQGVFHSVPITKVAWPNWQAVFRPS